MMVTPEGRFYCAGRLAASVQGHAAGSSISIYPCTTMANKKRPEQQSTTGETAPGEPAAIPTGEEVYQNNPSRQGAAAAGQEFVLPAGGEDPGEDDRAERGGSSTWQSYTSDAYDRIRDAAGQLSDQAAGLIGGGREVLREHRGGTVLGAFALGILIGVLSSNRDA